MQTFTNEPIDLAQLPKYEEVPLEKIAPSYWKIIILNISIFYLVIIGIAVGISFTDAKFEGSNWIPFVAIGLLLVLTVWGYWASFKRRGFALREKDIIYKSGIIAATTTIVPLKNIQHIELNEGWLSRILNLGTIEIFTAGGGTGHVQISGLPVEKARALKEALLKQVDLVSEANATV